jgi:hypothetical protein
VLGGVSIVRDGPIARWAGRDKHHFGDTSSAELIDGSPTNMSDGGGKGWQGEAEEQRLLLYELLHGLDELLHSAEVDEGFGSAGTSAWGAETRWRALEQ